MAAPRAYKLIKEGKAHASVMCPDVVAQGKLHPLIAYEYSKGPGLLYIGGIRRPMFRIEIFWLDEETDEVYSDGGFTTIKEETAISYIEKAKIKYANGVPKKGRKSAQKVVES